TYAELEDMRQQHAGEYSFGDTRTFQFTNPAKNYSLEYVVYAEQTNPMTAAITKTLPLLLGIVVAVSVICSYVYTLLFAKPVEKLSAVSRSMAQMDFTRKCEPKRKDEIGDLGRDLDRMAEALDEKIHSLEDKNEELEEEVTRRRELENQKDMFFSAASHELKTPVTILEGQIRGMIDNVGPYSDHDIYLPKALGTVKRMESLINEILTASRMQSGKEIVASRVDMVQLLEEKMEECEDLFTSRGIKPELSFENGLIFEGNKDLTSLAVGAFLSNAAFYSEEGTTVYIDAERSPEESRAAARPEAGAADGTTTGTEFGAETGPAAGAETGPAAGSSSRGMIAVSIRNRGHIEDEDLTHLFEPFYRADKSRSRRSGGSGLGLYLAKLIVEKQGGSCHLTNDGEDVLATIEIPAAAVSA
ncbi:MAG: HAMP domain-containing histidine kinase, partial [Lachnospiraceae bacterium]|nr:HAMP domain-containing histidine kinase [Lachnospiraceae bacterium]